MDILQALEQSQIAVLLRRPGMAYPLVNAAHIMSLGLIFGAMTVLDLRLLGLFRAFSVRALGPPLARTAACGVALAIVTGILLFSVRPDAYVENTAFLVKLVLAGLGIANAVILSFTPHWRRVLEEGDISMAVKASAVLSLVIWTSAIIAGRWIAFLS